MASGVATVWVPLDDMNRAVRFYGETLGLDVKTEGDDWTEFDANGDVSMIRWISSSRLYRLAVTVGREQCGITRSDN